jgi:hypothetical protein
MHINKPIQVFEYKPIDSNGFTGPLTALGCIVEKATENFFTPLLQMVYDSTNMLELSAAM